MSSQTQVVSPQTNDQPTSSSIKVTLQEAFPEFEEVQIRVDEATQQASVIDVIRMITGKKSGHASDVIKTLDNQLTEKIGQLRINGKGRETPVAPAPVLIEMIWELPGKKAKEFRRRSAHYICRLLSGDMSLMDDIERRYHQTTDTMKTFLRANTEGVQAVHREASSRVEDNETQPSILAKRKLLHRSDFLQMFDMGDNMKRYDCMLLSVLDTSQSLSQPLAKLLEMRNPMRLQMHALQDRPTPKRRKHTYPGKDTVARLWIERMGNTLSGICEEEDCLKNIHAFSINLALKDPELSRFTSELYSSDNVMIVCSSCKHRTSKMYSTSSKRAYSWLTWYGNTFEVDCLCCDSNKLSFLDSWHGGHITPHSRGGCMESNNIVPICNQCNMQMSNTNMEEYMAQRGREGFLQPQNTYEEVEILFNDLKRGICVDDDQLNEEEVYEEEASGEDVVVDEGNVRSIMNSCRQRWTSIEEAAFIRAVKRNRDNYRHVDFHSILNSDEFPGRSMRALKKKYAKLVSHSRL